LDDSKIDNLVVLVDDLDRCTPDRIIDTLEAIKLFLSVKRTTFIIAADETVIQYAIRKKYPPIDGSSVEISSEYIEKIIQLPVYIPDLSSKDIENYLLLLVAQLYINQDKFKLLLQSIFKDKLILKEESLTLEELRKRIDVLDSPFKDRKNEIEFNKDIEIINSIKNIVSSTLKGNPRQAKRFLNTFITKKTLSQMYFGDELNMQILAKLLVLQKLSSTLFKQLNDWDKDFKMNNEQLKLVYDCVKSNPKSIPEEYTQWATPRIIRWLECEPRNLYEMKLDKYFYLSREELKNNNDSMNGLSEKSKDILKRLGKCTEATIDQIVEQLKISGPQIIEEVIDVLLPNIKKGDVEFFIIKKIFSSCPSYRDTILIQVKNMPKSKFTASCIPYLKSMHSEDPDKVKPILDGMIDKNLSRRMYDLIVERKEK
ncbi:MAG: P-loop NTPase fold protein, partial [Caulobacteraceae bacterium]